MIIYAIVDKRIVDLSLDNTSYKKYQFYGNVEHLFAHKDMYFVVGDEIKPNPNYDQEQLEIKATYNLSIIRDKRKPLLQAFDIVEMKRKFALEGFIAEGEFPFLDTMTEERWLEIKQWRDNLRDLTDGDLINYVFPETPPEVKYFT